MDLALNLVVGNVLAGVIARPLEHSYVVMAPLHQPETPGAEQSNNLPGLFISVGRKALVAGRFVADGALALLLGKQVAPLRRSHSFVHWHCKFLPWLTDCWKWAMVGNEAYRLDHQRNIVVEMPQPRVAVVTEKRTKFPGNVVVVGMQSPVLGASTRKSSADSTSAALHGKDRFVLVAIAAQPVVLVEQEVHSVGSMSRVFPPIVASLLRAGLAAIAEAIWFPLMLRKVGPRYRRLTERAYLFIGAACRTLWARDQVGTDFLFEDLRIAPAAGDKAPSSSGLPCFGVVAFGRRFTMASIAREITTPDFSGMLRKIVNGLALLAPRTDRSGVRAHRTLIGEMLLQGSKVTLRSAPCAFNNAPRISVRCVHRWSLLFKGILIACRIAPAKLVPQASASFSRICRSFLESLMSNCKSFGCIFSFDSKPIYTPCQGEGA
jgi:hypothetical protein